METQHLTSTVLGQLQTLVLEQAARRARRPTSDVRLSDRLTEDLALDSLDVVEIVLAIEQVYDLSVPDATLVRAITVADLIDAAEACWPQEDVQQSTF